MRKNLIITLAITFALGITGTAFAAPTADEMAQELAALKAKVAEMEKSLKVVKAKSTETSKLSFENSDFRIRWVKDGKDEGDSVFEQRVRLNMNYKVNDQITFNTRWRVTNENELGKTGLLGKDNNLVSDANVSLKDVLGATMTAGRFSQAFGATSYWNSTALGLIDGVKFATKIDDVKMTVGFANFSAYATPKTTYATKYDSSTGKYTTTATTTSSPALEDALFMNASYAASKATTINAMWVKEKSGADSNFDVKGLGVSTTLDADWKFVGDYTRNYAQANDPSGYFLSLRWKGANDAVPGSFGIRLSYRDIKDGNMFSTLGNGVSIPTMKYKGPAISANYTLYKNAVLTGYQTFKTKDAGTGQTKPNYSRIEFTVGF